MIICCAVTGGDDNAHKSAAIPVTPAQIAAESLAAHAAGAAIAHIHVRDPRTGKPSRDLALYREVVARIRDAGTDLLINLTTGPGAKVVPGFDPPHLATGSTLASPEERIAHVLELRPDLCSLDVATMNFGRHAKVNVPGHLETMARLIQEAGVKPELEVFDLGHVALASHMAANGCFTSPPLLQLVMGVSWGAPATAEGLLAMRAGLPPGTIWSALGISRQQLPMVAQAALLGGHVRVGLEDNLYVSRGVLAPGNAALVQRAVTVLQAMGAEVATSAHARAILGRPSTSTGVGKR